MLDRSVHLSLFFVVYFVTSLLQTLLIFLTSVNFFLSRNVLSHNRRQSSIFTNNAHVALEKRIYTPSVDNGWPFLMMKIGNEIQSANRMRIHLHGPCDIGMVRHKHIFYKIFRIYSYVYQSKSLLHGSF